MQSITGATGKAPHVRANRFQHGHGVIRFLIIWLLLWLSYCFRHVLFDVTPPSLNLTGVEPGKTYRGRIPLNISACDERSGIGTLTVQINDDIPEHLSLDKDGANRTIWTLDTTALPEREYTVTVAATDRSLWKHTVRHELVFSVDNTPPQFQLSPESLHVRQGKTLGIFVQSNGPLAELEGKIFDRIVRFYPFRSKNVYRGLIGVSVTQPAKRYPLALEAKDSVGQKMNRTFRVTVGTTKFARGGYIVLSPNKQKVMGDKSKSREDNAKRAKAYRKSASTQLWEGTFAQPAEGLLTSPFGKYREYNTGVRRHHLGTDIANDVGTPIYAGNDGVVTLAERLHLYGNAIIIDHGQGVSTSYNHLSEIGVNVGDTLKKGQRIGLMGATGQVTGSHLHWGMVVNGVAVDPEEWTESDFFREVVDDIPKKTNVR